MQKVTTFTYPDFSGSGIRPVKLNIWIRVFIVLFWIAQIFGSLDFQVNVNFGLQTIFLPVQYFFANKFYIPIFTGYEFLIFVFIIILIISFHGKVTATTSILKKLFITSCIVVFFVIINPNNDYSKFFYVLLKDIKTWILFLVFMYIIWFLDLRNFYSFMVYLLKTGVIVAVLRALIALAAFISGNPMYLWSEPSTIIQGDTLLWLATFHIILFGIFLVKRKKLYLILSLILFACIALSFRRTSLFLCVITDLLLFFSYSYIYRKKIRFVSNAFIFALAILIFVYFFGNNSKVQTYLNRYFAVVEFTGVVEVSDKYKGEEFTDSGHLNQSITTTRTFFKNLNIFWGSGLREKVKKVEGQSGAIHNNIVFVWASYGMFMVVYLLIIFFTCLSVIFKTIRYRRNIFFLRFLCYTIMIYQFMELIAGWLTGYTFIGILPYSTKFVLVMSVVKFYHLGTINSLVNDSEKVSGIHVEG